VTSIAAGGQPHYNPRVSRVAVLGAGPVGAAVVHHLAERARVREVRLIDEDVSVAEGKALDLRQTGPVDGVDVSITASGDVGAAAGADVIVIADRALQRDSGRPEQESSGAGAGEWQGEAGLALVRQIARTGGEAALVFAGGSQTWLMEAAHMELHLPAHRLIGTAASGVTSAVRALANAELGLSGVDLTVAGRPPAFVIAWSAATVAGMLVTDRIPAHRLLALSRSLARLWPPGPQTTGAATARVIAALIDGSRRPLPAMTILEGELGVRRVAAMLPLELGRRQVLRRIVPSLSPQERTELLNALAT
jgi:malate dehydrogenase